MILREVVGGTACFAGVLLVFGSGILFLFPISVDVSKEGIGALGALLIFTGLVVLDGMT